MKVEPARLQQAVDGLEIRTVIGDPDVLEHADRGDPVEIALDQRIVAQLDRYLVLESEAETFSFAYANCSSASVTPTTLTP